MGTYFDWWNSIFESMYSKDGISVQVSYAPANSIEVGAEYQPNDISAPSIYRNLYWKNREQTQS